LAPFTHLPNPEEEDQSSYEFEKKHKSVCKGFINKYLKKIVPMTMTQNFRGK
jgi:hypothetical protein